LSIFPLPQFEADLEEDRKIYQALKVPKTLVVRYGLLMMVGEFPYDGDVKPGCGSKLVIRTPRGTEIGEMLTSTCPNSGCSKSVSRKDMLDYIQNSGGRDYPFATEGRVLRVATTDDMQAQQKLEQSRHGLKLEARRVAEHYNLPMKVVDAEPVLGGERITVYFNSEERVDFRELVRDLAHQWKCRVEMRQVGARDEARITADYERCGQYCCCKNFLKVLKPVSMRSAKIQKATLDPLKISGRCGRLMCCLRYEDQTYEELRKRLPKRKQRVGTPEGNGIVLDTQILTQLALVLLEGSEKQVAIPVEELTAPTEGPPPAPRTEERAEGPRGARPERPPSASGRPGERPRRRDGRDGRPDDRRDQQPRPEASPVPPPPPPPSEEPEEAEDLGPDDVVDNAATEPGSPPTDGTPGTAAEPGQSGEPRRRRRRRRRRRGGGGPGDGQGSGGPPPPPSVPG
jgi:cell fate regulator YaaT (PSP1 superfamily)